MNNELRINDENKTTMMSNRPKNKRLLIRPCYNCQEKVTVQFINNRRNWSQLNNWGYWTEKEENNDKYICRTCIRQLYYERPQDYYTSITTEKKRKVLRTYLNQGWL